MSLNLLAELVIILAASVCIIFVFHKIKLPPVVGFLLTGILIGPGGLSLVKDTRTVDVLAEIGVVMLLFMVGLEFTLERLKRIQRNFWIGGGLQVVLTIAAAALLLILLHIPARQAIFFGFLISLSSTAVVLKILGDRNETDSPQGMISLGILIFQDMAIVPMIAFVPILANVRSAAPTAILVRFLLSAAAIGAVFGIARFLMPRVLHAVVGTRIREMFLISSLLLCLGMSGLTSLLGLSMALGAFLAGVIISESEYSHQVVSDILPFRDLFNSLFFISIGMMLQVGSLVQSVGVVAGLVLSIIVLKAAIVFLTVRLLGYDSRIAVLTGLALAQVGEFSFVLAGVGRANDLMPGSVFQIFLASSILTIIATPFLIQISPGLAAKTRDRTERKRRVSDAGEGDGRKLKDHVIIAGYGLNGRNLANVLREAGIAFVVVDLNPEAIRIAAERKDPFIFGDASSRTILRAAGIGGAKAVVFAISDPATTRRGVRTARQMERGVYIVVRTLHVAEIEELYGLGADDVIPEEFETSVEIFIHVLERFHIPRNVIDAQVKVIRNECYGLLRGTCEAFRPSAERVADLLSAGTADSYFIGRGAWPAGLTLKDVDLRNRTGATVIAVVRGEESFTSPGAEFAIEAGDTLVLVASHRDMNRAFDYLRVGPPGEAPGGTTEN